MRVTKCSGTQDVHKQFLKFQLVFNFQRMVNSSLNTRLRIPGTSAR